MGDCTLPLRCVLSLFVAPLKSVAHLSADKEARKTICQILPQLKDTFFTAVHQSVQGSEGES